MLLTVEQATGLEIAVKFGLEELCDGDVLAETFTSARLENKVPRCGLGRGRLERAQLDLFVQRVAWHDGPSVED